jgi:signal transduction histidine kinase/HAMP domain-containing protein
MKMTWKLEHKISLFAILISSAVIIATSLAGAFTYHSLATEQAEQQIQVLAQVTAFNSAAPSMFADAEAANTVLKALSADHRIISAHLLNTNQQRLAQYRRVPDARQESLQHLSVAVQWQDKQVGELVIDIDMSALNQQLYRQIGLSLLFTLVAVLIAGLLVRWMSHTLTSPLRQLSDVAQSIGRQGDYSLRALPSEAHDEVSQLTINFNEMLAHIEKQDIDLREQQDVLHASEQRLLLATESAGLGVWDLNVPEDSLKWDDKMFELYETKRGSSTNNLQTWVNCLHPDDKEQTINDFEAALQGLREFDTLFRIICPNGRTKYIKANALVLRNSDGSPRRILGVNADVTTREMTMVKLEQKNAELEHYAHMVSHDLKSPLVTIKTFLAYLQLDMVQGDTARIEKDMDFMDKAANKMGQLLNELQQMSSVGRVVAIAEHVSWRAAVEEALNINAGAIAQRGVAVTVEDADISLFGDKARLVQIWQNLIDNAVKFLGEQASGQIHIGVLALQQGAEFYVCDNGCGVDCRYHGKIFGLFEKLDSKVPGSGLGLALVKRIVQMYEGEIRIESMGIGQGSCFRFTLPTAVKTNTGVSL